MSDMEVVSLVAFIIGGGLILFMVCYSIDMMASVALEAIRAKVKLECDRAQRRSDTAWSAERSSQELRRPKND